jgi:hypothetical protein
VPEPVDALVGEEARPADLGVGADLAGPRRKLGLGRADERALDDPVVVPGPAGRPALSERSGHVPVVVDERSRADRVGDAVAVRLDRLVVGELLLEEIERRLRALAVGDVTERLPPAVRV